MRSIEVGEPDSRSWCNRFRVMGLYTVKNDICTITEAGNELFENRNALPVVRGLVNGFKYYDGVLPKVLQDGSATEDSIVEFFASEHDEKVDPWHVRCRLMWIAGLGLGELHEKHLVLSTEGSATIDRVLREIEIRERDLQEQEADKRKRYFSVRQITDLEKFVEAANELDADRKAALLKVSKRFTSYPFSVIDVLDQPIETACEIFERINNSGKVLNVVDLMVAKSWSPTFNLRERLATFREELKRQHYDDIPDITILQCIAGVLQRSVQRKSILSIEKGMIESSWESVLESIRQAIDFLKGNLRIIHAKVLPYNAILVPLAYFFHSSTASQHTDEVRASLVKWFWRASVSNRYDASAETKIGDDIAEMGKLAAGREAAFDYVSPPLVADRIASQRLNLGSAFCKTILCILNTRAPRELKDSSPVLLTSFSKFNAAELHHIFPKAYLRRHDKAHYPDRDSMANIALARAAANKGYSNKAPSRYIRGCENPRIDEVLFSHFIDNKDSSGILDDDFENFVKYRSERILDEMRRLTGRMTEVEADFKGSEAKAIESFELRMRSLLDSTLREIDPDYWQMTGSPEFRQGIENRIEGWLKANPARGRSEAREVDFCQILEYLKVAKAHWLAFKRIFRSRSDLETHLKNVSNFRNALMHNREIDLATQQLALGSLSWFDEVFKAEDG